MTTEPEDRPASELLAFGEADLLAASWRGAHVDMSQSGLFALAVGLVVD